MRNYDKIISPTSQKTSSSDSLYIQQTTLPTTTFPVTASEITTQNPRRSPVKKPTVLVGPKSSTHKLLELSKDGQVGAPKESREEAPTHRNYGDYVYLNQRYPITEVSDSNLPSDCGVESSRPPYSPCLSRKLVDELFLACCQQHVPSNCHSLCTYEHREHVAAETLIQAIQQDMCDLKYVSSILYCANRNRDNRECCQFLGLTQPELGVGDRCLRMCNIAQSGDRVGTVERNDLVCLSNWNVIMYCARAGLRTIN